MGHTFRDEKNLLHRVRRIRGRIDAVERALEPERGGAAVTLTAPAGRGVIRALMVELPEDHRHAQVLDLHARLGRGQAVDEVSTAFRGSLR
jgi:DNA-binding FrmR family transcriptional regulator